MISIYHKSSYAWSLADYKTAFNLLNNYLKSDLNEDIFSIDDYFFDRTDDSYWHFLQRLTNNSHRRNAFCSTFSSLWKDFPSESILRILVAKDFSEPSMIKALGMENFGFEEPQENFDKVIAPLRKSAHQGFLTNLPQLGAFDGRIHLNYDHLNNFLENPDWEQHKSSLLNFEKELRKIDWVPWNELLKTNHCSIVSTFLHQAFGEFKRNPTENFHITTGSLELNLEWKNTISTSIEMIFEEFNENDINELVNSTCQIQSSKLSGKEWLQTYLDYTIHFDSKVFLKLY